MRDTLIYIAGRPASGKSTLMVELTRGFARRQGVDAPVAYDELWLPARDNYVGIEIGTSRRRGEFSGTDALPAKSIGYGVQWIATAPERLVLAEGARFSNIRFFTAARRGLYNMVYVLLAHPQIPEWEAARAERTGRVPNPDFSDRRARTDWTISEKLKEWGATVFIGHPDEIVTPLHELIAMY